MNAFETYITPLHKAFYTLPQRDQRAVLVLIGVLLALFLWMGVWQPVERARTANAASYLAASADFNWMQAHMNDIKPADASASAPANASLLSAATDSAALYKITINHAEPVEDGSLNISFDTVTFSRLIPWLDVLQRGHSISVKHATLEKQASPGNVSATFTFTQKN